MLRIFLLMPAAVAYAILCALTISVAAEALKLYTEPGAFLLAGMAAMLAVACAVAGWVCWKAADAEIQKRGW